METNEGSKNKRRLPLGVLSFGFAIVAALSVTMIGVTSFTAFNPPDWLRIMTMAPFPFLVILAVLFGIASLLMKKDRTGAIAGLVIAGLSVIAFGIMISQGG